MKPRFSFFFCALTLLTACNGQIASKNIGGNSTSKVGETVSELSNSLLIVFQASNGSYWFGSDNDGFYKVDGTKIVHFSMKDGLSNNRIRGIQEDKKGNIYISTLDGIDKFDGQNLTKLNVIKENNWRLHPDDLWFCMPGLSGASGLFRYDGKNLYELNLPKYFMEDEYYTKFPNKPWSPYEVYSIYKDEKGSMWFGTANLGLCRYDGSSFKWLYEDELTNTPNGGSFGIRSVIEDKKGEFWISNTNYRFTFPSGSIAENDSNLIDYKKHEGIQNLKTDKGDNFIYFMSATLDNEGNLWFATYDQGVWYYDGESVKQYLVKDKNKIVTLYSIYRDKEDNLWLGTHDSKIYKFSGKTFEKFSI